jgi:hypothetical protein
VKRRDFIAGLGAAGASPLAVRTATGRRCAEVVRVYVVGLGGAGRRAVLEARSMVDNNVFCVIIQIGGRSAVCGFLYEISVVIV